MLILTKKDIKQTLVYEEYIQNIERAYAILHSGDFFMPSRPVFDYKEQNKIFMWMPSFVDGAIGGKIISMFADNSKLGVPAIHGFMILNDYTTGKPIALMEGQTITAFRTGAISGTSIKYLSHPDCHTLGVVGTGTQAFHQILFACHVRDIRKVYIHNLRPKDLSAFIRQLQETMPDNDIEYIIADTIETLLENSEIVITATASPTPVLPDDAELLKGKCYIAVGSFKPNTRELPPCLTKSADLIYTELPFACEETGDLKIPIETGAISKEKVKFFSDFLHDKPDLGDLKGKTVVMKSVGMALFDLCTAQFVYQHAKEIGVGQEIDFF